MPLKNQTILKFCLDVLYAHVFLLNQHIDCTYTAYTQTETQYA